MRRSLFISCGCFIIAAGLYRFSTDFASRDQDEHEVAAVYTASSTTGRTFDALGRPVQFMQAEQVHYYEQNDFFRFEAPIFTSYDYHEDGSAEVWQIKGTSGELKHKQWTRIHGNVVLAPLFEGAQIQKATTEELLFDFKRKIVTAPDKVVIEGVGWTDSGYGFEADINKKTMVYKGGAHAVYFPQTPETPAQTR